MCIMICKTVYLKFVPHSLDQFQFYFKMLIASHVWILKKYQCYSRRGSKYILYLYMRPSNCSLVYRNESKVLKEHGFISPAGRRAVISGELEEAIVLFEKCEQSPIDWIQV